MDYFERLIRRALATPRDAAQDLFDPFDQVAAWTLDDAVEAPEVLPPGIVQKAVASPQPAVPAPPLMPAAVSVGTVPPVVVPLAATFGAPDAPGEFEQRAAVPGDRPAMPPAPLQLPPGGTDPLTRADAFMRGLGVQSPVPAEPAARPREAAPTALRPAQPPELPQPVRVSAGPVLLRPNPPQPAPLAPHVADAVPARKNVRAETQGAAVPPAGRVAPTPPSVERVVQTTVVVASAARGLDDLAYSSGISRFGIGQG
jgi:hypothetical protein